MCIFHVRTGSSLETKDGQYQKICSEIMCVPQLGVNFQMCLEQVWHVFFSQGLQFFTYLQIGSNFSVQPSPVLWYKVSPHKISIF